jgi:hypothetical protein
MAELSNQSHLAEMGITRWYARFSLLGAAPSPEIRVNSEIILKKRAGFSEPSPVSADSLPASRQNIVNIKSLVDEPLSPVSVEESTEPSIGDFKGEGEQQNFTRSDSRVSSEVSLDVYSAGQFVIISESSESGSRGEEIALLQNILHAAGTINAEIQFKGSFVWPIFKSLTLLVGSEHFYKHILGRWLSSVLLPQYRTCLIFGGRNQSLLADVDSIATPDVQCNKVFFQFSVSEMLKLPARKADFWAQFSASVAKNTSIGLE